MSDPSSSRLTHVDPEGRPTMVDVSAKDWTPRRAVAAGRIRMQPETLDAVLEERTPKGDVLRVAEVAGIMAGKKTADLIPLCHPLPGLTVRVRLHPDRSLPGLVAEVEAQVVGPTGVEMEALTAVMGALLTVYDMAKAIDRTMTIEAVRLLLKEGGASGSWVRPEGA